MPAIALTDHGTMFGAIDFYNAATSVGIKPIIGLETYLALNGMQSRDVQIDKKATHLLLLAENQTGYQNLLQIASAAQLQGFYYYPRIDHAFLAAHSEGLICTSGCMSSEIPRLILNERMEEATKRLDWYYEVFGPDRYFLELQDHNIPELANLNQILLDLGMRYESNFIATNDVHYINEEDARLQDIMLAVQTGSVLSDPKRMRMTDSTYYLRSADEMSRLFAEVPSAISNTLLIAERCNVDLGFKGYHLPEFNVPQGYTAETYLRQLCEEGLIRRLGTHTSDRVYRERLEYELGIIHRMGFDTYFLIVWDLCRYAREKEIWYNARGSAAGSIVAYCLDITLVDPIEHQLLFERFLNPGRISMPDIDLDFRDDRRADMLAYTAHKYGDDKVAQIVTFGTLGARAAIRDVGRVMDIPLTEVDRVAKLIPNIPGKPVTIETALDEVTELKQIYDTTGYLKELIDTAAKVEGVVRNAGTHAAGVIITDKPIIEYVPLHRPTGSSAEDSPVKTVTQFEMSVLDSLGLLKVDFLGLATLTIMARACDLIRLRTGKVFTLANIPIDDPATYELMGRGETAGVFQVEGAGMRRWLMQMKPKGLANVIAMVALFRPGPMDFIPSYIKRMHGEEEITYRHPQLQSILEETYGITVYQEQIMFTAMKVAGYTASEADNLRKGVAKKMADVLLKHRQTFVGGATQRGIPEDIANLIFDDWEAFARYGFPKGHAADYGVIAVQTAYLKVYYPVEYMTALLSVNQNDTAKVALYVADARRMGLQINPPDVNFSEWDFSIEDAPDGTSAIRFGLGAVKNVGQAPVEVIIKAREAGPFKDLNDFARRVDLRQVGKRSLECLIKVGALDSLGERSSLLAGVENIVSVSSSHFKAVDQGQMSLFGVESGLAQEIQLPPANLEYSRRELLSWEKELIGLYVSDHPLTPVLDLLNQTVTHFSGQLSDAAHQEKVRVAGLVTRSRPHQTKAGKPMGFVTIEDVQGPIELVLFPRTWDRFASLLEHEHIVVIDGKVDNENGEPKVLVDSVTTELTSYEVVTPHPPPDASPARPQPAAGMQTRPGAQTYAGQRAPKQVREQTSVRPSTPSPAPEPLVPTASNGSAPPPPDAFPPDWNYQEIVPNGFVLEGQRSDPIATLSEPPTQERPAQPEEHPLEDSPVTGEDSSPTPDINPPLPPAASQVSPGSLPPSNPIATIVASLPPAEQISPVTVLPHFVNPTPPVIGEEVHLVTVILRPSEDKARDNLRLRQVYGTLISYPGQDRFALMVYERGRGYQIEFPNFTTGLNPELLGRLQRLAGAENVHIETLTFQ